MMMSFAINKLEAGAADFHNNNHVKYTEHKQR